MGCKHKGDFGGSGVLGSIPMKLSLLVTCWWNVGKVSSINLEIFLEIFSYDVFFSQADEKKKTARP